MPTLQIDNRTLTVEPGVSLLDAAGRLGIKLPSLCFRGGLEHVTSCMVCVVEDCKSGELLPACSMPAAEGMTIATGGETVLDARRTALELLLGDHVGDCEGPCRRACPAGLEIPAMLRAIASDRFGEAERIVRSGMALPSVLCRICSAPCEKVCRRALHDAPLAIRRLVLHAADAGPGDAADTAAQCADSGGLRVAVIGAGPAGLSAARRLRRQGHECVLFEKGEAPGGGLRACLPDPRLPHAVLDAAIHRILSLGVTLQTGFEIGSRDADPLDRILRRFQAVILATGEIDRSRAERFGLEWGARGLKSDPKTGRTSDPRVFAAGSVILPVRLAARAAGQGDLAAIHAGRMLRGDSPAKSPHRYDHRLAGKLSPEELEVYLAAGASAAGSESADSPAPGSSEKARLEAARCLDCDCRKARACKLRRYASETGVDGRRFRSAQRRRIEMIRNGNVVYEPGKCIACGICVRITAEAREPLGLTFIGRGFDVRVGVPFNEPLAQGLQKVAAACIAACPTGALGADRKRKP